MIIFEPFSNVRNRDEAMMRTRRLQAAVGQERAVARQLMS